MTFTKKEKPEEEADLGKMVKIPALDMLKVILLHPCGDVKSSVEFRQSCLQMCLYTTALRRIWHIINICCFL